MPTETALLRLATALAGLTLREIAAQQRCSLPRSLQHAKGWVGQLVESCLGAEAGNQALPDFPRLGIELKTVPIDHTGRPMEGTYVCRASAPPFEPTFEASRVWHKLQAVLWVPVEATKTTPLPDRRIGLPFLWRPNTDEQARLRADWDFLTEQLTLGDLNQSRALYGDCLQLRPKAANSTHPQAIQSLDGDAQHRVPRGFYLRRSFTAELLVAQIR